MSVPTPEEARPPREAAAGEPLPAVPGLVLLGAEDAPVCSDGVCR